MLLSQLLLVLSACALGGGALRVARAVTDGGLIEQVLFAAPLAGGFVVCWTLALGLAGLSGSSLALAAGPIVGWLLVRLLIKDRGSVASTLWAYWNEWPRRERMVALGLLGLAAGCVLEVALEPALGNDALWYHLADVVGWLHSGHAGSVQTFSYDLPFGYYPVTGEVMLTWVLGISRSFAPLAIWSTAIVALTLLALWRLLDVLRVPRPVAIAALSAFGTLPLVLQGLNQAAPGTDVLAVMWLACAAALCARAAARPALLGPALVAVGLGAGTKTTVVPLAAVALAAGVWSARARLRAVRPWLVGGAIGGLLAGGPWYARNTFVHGWPLWPFEAGPTGSPLPHFISLFHESFLQRPRVAIDTLGNLYLTWMAGGLALIAGAVATPFVTRSRAALALAALALASLLVWATAPFTGLAHIGLLEIVALSTVRYILPAFGACTVAIGVAARDAGRTWRRLSILLLAGSTAGSLVADATLGHAWIPKLQFLLIGGLAGAAIGAMAPSFRARAVPNLTRIGMAALVIAFLALSAPGWLGRQSTSGSYDQAVLAYMMAQPGFVSGTQPISFAPEVLASLAGPRLKHPLELIPAGATCAAVRASLRWGWVVVLLNQYAPGITTPFDAPYCLIGDHPRDVAGEALIYGPSA